MTIAPGFHLFPFRTEKLSPVTPMVLRNSGRVGSRRFFSRAPAVVTDCGGFFYGFLPACRQESTASPFPRNASRAASSARCPFPGFLPGILFPASCALRFSSPVLCLAFAFPESSLLNPGAFYGLSGGFLEAFQCAVISACYPLPK